MKKVILGALVVFTGLASATSLRTVKLEVKTAPLGHMNHAGLTTYIQVLGDGAVLGTECKPRHFGRCAPSVHLDQLSKQEMRRIDRLIARASRGSLIDPNPGGIYCMAIPFQSTTYSANNGSLILKSGSFPCGGSMVNDTNAGEELVEILDGYKNGLNEHRSSAEMEELG